MELPENAVEMGKGWKGEPPNPKQLDKDQLYRFFAIPVGDVDPQQGDVYRSGSTAIAYVFQTFEGVVFYRHKSTDGIVWMTSKKRIDNFLSQYTLWEKEKTKKSVIERLETQLAEAKATKLRPLDKVAAGDWSQKHYGMRSAGELFAAEFGNPSPLTVEQLQSCLPWTLNHREKASLAELGIHPADRQEPIDEEPSGND